MAMLAVCEDAGSRRVGWPLDRRQVNEDQPQHPDHESASCCSGLSSPVPPDTKDRDASGIAAVNDRVVTEHEFPESGRTVFDGLPNVRELADSPERRLKHFAVDRTLSRTPLSLGVTQDEIKLAQCAGRNNDLNT
jgi:hypothetical protein